MRHRFLDSASTRLETAAGWALVTAASLICALSPLPVRAAGDAAAGQKVYAARCMGCHGDLKSTSTFGPNLTGIVGRKAGTGESGVHSRALVESGITWDEASLRKFLAAPTKQVPGTNMPVDVPDPKQIDDVVAYLRTLR
jgi:cytochrome c